MLSEKSLLYSGCDFENQMIGPGAAAVKYPAVPQMFVNGHLQESFVSNNFGKYIQKSIAIAHSNV